MRRVIALVLAACVPVAACAKKPRAYEANVSLRSLEVVSWDDTGKPRIVEVSVEYPDCPGEQLETLQGNAEFTTCILQHKPGEVLRASIEWGPTDYGHYDSEITKLGDCTRKRDPRDARSYEVVQECEDVTINGVVAGFHCDRKPNKELLAKCPWFQRE